MKKMLLIVLLSLGMLISAEINVLNSNPNAEIYINGKLAGKEYVSGYQVKQGMHSIKVKIGKYEVYSKIININKEAVWTIDTTTFVDMTPTNIPNRGPMLVEAERIREARGNLALGIYASERINGFSIKHFFGNNLGIQFVGGVESIKGSSTESLMFRGLYELGNYIFLERHMNLYLALGIGQSTISDAFGDTVNNFQQATIGIEGTAAALGLPIALGSFVMLGVVGEEDSKLSEEEAFWLLASFAGIGVSIAPNMYFDFEIGYEKSQINGGVSDSGMVISGGLSLYF